MFNMYGNKQKKGLKIFGYALAILVAISMIILYFPIWRQ